MEDNTYEPYQIRVIDEKQELDVKIAKLEAFSETESFSSLSKEEQDRLLDQLYHMIQYSEILEQRIENF